MHMVFWVMCCAHFNISITKTKMNSIGWQFVYTERVFLNLLVKLPLPYTIELFELQTINANTRFEMFSAQLHSTTERHLHHITSYTVKTVWVNWSYNSPYGWYSAHRKVPNRFSRFFKIESFVMKVKRHEKKTS